MRQVLIAIDQLINAFFGGWADETLSSRAWRKGQDGGGWGVLRAVIDSIFFWQVDHCRGSYESELNRNHLPAAMRKGGNG